MWDAARGCVDRLPPCSVVGGCSMGKKVCAGSCMFVEDSQRVRRVCLLANKQYIVSRLAATGPPTTMTKKNFKLVDILLCLI